MMVMQPPAWTERYIGIPFVEWGRTIEGCDCWGLVRMVLAEEVGIRLPSLDTHTAKKLGEKVSVISNWDDWIKINKNHERPFDIVEMTTPVCTPEGWAFPSLHVGIVVSFGWMLHIEKSTSAVLVRYLDDWMINKRIAAFWRNRCLVK